MSRTRLTTTMPKRDVSSAGASPISYMRPWDLDPFDGGNQTEGTVESWPLAREQREPGTGYAAFIQSFVLAQQTAGVYDATDASRLRYLCARLLNQIPERGLGELFECLKQIIKFYREEPQSVPTQPVIRRLPAKWGQTYQRPDFYLDLDEE